MTKLSLDYTKLLGFRIDAAAGAKIGTKDGAKIGAKVGGKGPDPFAR